MLSKSLLVAGLALPAQILSLKLHENLEVVPRGWSHVAEPAASHPISLEIELQMSNVDKMIDALMAVSTPGNAQYGKHYSREQASAMVSPSDEANLATIGWLNASGIDQIEATWHSVKINTTVSKANKLLGTKFSIYQHEATGVQKLRTTQYSVHEDVAQHIDLIHPATYFGKPIGAVKAMVKPLAQGTPLVQGTGPKPQAVDPYPCTQYLSPDCAKTLYNVPLNYTPHNNAGASIGFGSFLGESAQESDLLAFENYFNIANQTFPVTTIAGGVNVQNSSAVDGEANLDAQNIVGVSHPLPVREWITGGFAPFNPNLLEPAGSPSNEPYLVYYNYLLSQTNQDLPQVISNSYGDEENSVPMKYAVRSCNLIGMMGLRGITIIESSGDEGVGATCLSQGKHETPQFDPIFPATCPYLTSVGGTVNYDNQMPWDGSSGGFSFYFPRPAYQETAVNTYLNKHVEPSTAIYYTQGGFTNFSGRGFPDVAANSLSPDWLVVVGGRLSLSGGTSAAAPFFAGIVALINDERLSKGKAALGFLNPYLYSSGHKSLTDITNGTTIGCNDADTQGNYLPPGSGVIPYATWNATAGWDPTTGFGVPNFLKMLKTWGTV